ncbi:BMP family ABC transporter substrate-binding protein [Pseudarthrobacter sp. C1]|nr:BMP family ABC transporter substrate-binding protein [Pseudarthrobacter sp. C1]
MQNIYQRRKMKRELAVLAVIGIALTGCSAQSVAPKTGENAASSSASKSGFNGLQRAHDQLGVEISYKEGVEPEKAALESALDELASSGVDMVIAHGGQNAEAAKTVAQRFPETMFVVTQANVTGPNLSSYEVLQEESAWLAGAAAGLLTETNVVGHMSGIRPIPGLKGRAAFVDGVAHTNPQATVLSNFSGDQDDIELS